jgi:hypothetical protein
MTKPSRAGRMCIRCGEREQESLTLQLCRRCERETDDGRSTFEREAEVVARRRAKLAAVRPTGEPELPEFEEVCVNGQWFEIRRNGAIQKVLSDGRAWEDPVTKAEQ